MLKSIVLAGGCFWGVQKFFDQFQEFEVLLGMPMEIMNIQLMSRSAVEADTLKLLNSSMKIQSRLYRFLLPTL